MEFLPRIYSEHLTVAVTWSPGKWLLVTCLCRTGQERSKWAGEGICSHVLTAISVILGCLGVEGGGGGLSCCICKRLCWIHREKVIRGNMFRTHLETTFVWKQLSEQTEEMERKQASVGLPCSPIPKLFLEKISVPEVTCSQWMKRCPRIFLQVRREQCVIFPCPLQQLKYKSLPHLRSIRVLAVGGLY